MNHYYISNPLKRSSSQIDLVSEDPVAIRRKLEMSLPDKFDDATHARLNDEVLSNLEDVLSNLEDVHAAITVLIAIVQTAGNVLDQKYGILMEAKALLKENPDLLKMLKEAWKSRSFNEIRNLGTNTLLILCTYSNSLIRGSTTSRENPSTQPRLWAHITRYRGSR
jgi:hypothetical protein